MSSARLLGSRKLIFCVIAYVVCCYVVYSALRLHFSHSTRPALTYRDHQVTAPDHVSTKTTIIAVGGGITSKRLQAVNESNVAEKFAFLTLLLPSFCQTASSQFSYAFYLAYDYADRVFSNDRLSAAFVLAFRLQISKLCPHGITPTLQLINCSYIGNPAWAQNDAMLHAYLDNVDYFYRINDDTNMMTSRWAETFVAALDRYDPPRVGVVGPNHMGGNRGILTYDFVHRTHVDVFGFYYPRVFTDWFGDGWITRVYKPGRCTKMIKVRVKHTLGLGRRYEVNHTVRRLLQPSVRLSRRILNRYVEAVRRTNSSVIVDKLRVIAMCLHGSQPDLVWGVIRCAQLVPVYLPTWKLRVHVSSLRPFAVPDRVLNKLRQLGADIVQVPDNVSLSVPPRYWRLMAADDPQVRYFLQRNADWRLSEREAVSVGQWIKAAEESQSPLGVVHCIRDHPLHSRHPLVAGLWGGRPQQLRERLNGSSLMELVTTLAVRSTGDVRDLEQRVLQLFVWPAVSTTAYCHDAVSPCDRWKPRHHISVDREGQEFIGQRFNQHHEPVAGQLHNSTNFKC